MEARSHGNASDVSYMGEEMGVEREMVFLGRVEPSSCGVCSLWSCLFLLFSCRLVALWPRSSVPSLFGTIGRRKRLRLEPTLPTLAA